jgi:hypothetical protein
VTRVAKIVLGLMVLWGLLVSSSGSARADCIPDPQGGCRPVARFPVGIYAVVPVENRVSEARKQVPPFELFDPDTYLRGYFHQLLDNPAVAGLAVRVHWKSLNPGPPSDTDPKQGYDWSILQDAFRTIEAWNAAHPKNFKTIQLAITPGFFTPTWVFDQIAAAGNPACGLASDVEMGLLPPEVVTSFDGAGCGSAYFNDSEGKKTPVLTQLPLPWNTVYQGAWATFLRALGQKYGASTAFVSIAVAGPTSASTEMILPNDSNDPNHALTLWTGLLAAQFGSGSAYDQTDLAFTEAWDAAIVTFESIFDGVTLVATTGSGLPIFVPPHCATDPGRCPIPLKFGPVCDHPPGGLSMDCAAEATILADFSDAPGDAGKATQTSGIKRDHAGNDKLGLSGVKWLAAQTAMSPSPIPSTSTVLGGGQFGTSFSDKPDKEGSVDGVTLISPEQALYNVLQVVFDGTTVGPKYGVSDLLGQSSAGFDSFAPSNFKLSGPAPLNYLQIYDTDIVYASDPFHTVPVNIVGLGGNLYVTVQGLLDQARTRLLKIAE